MAVETIHVVFKTHLDLGFTDLGVNVTNKYVHEYIPKAIALGKELSERAGAAQFVWTTGSWLIHEALRLGTDAEQAELVAAIESGIVHWHALPMTTHTELMDPELVRHALQVGGDLDKRFGKRTRAAKMTDVPGHTVGLVPFLQEAGVEFLQLGVNGASPVPEVPEFFIWQAPDGSQVVVNYSQSYGASELVAAVAPSGTDALFLAHTGDNEGPPGADEVIELFAGLQDAYPGARIVASTLDAFAAAVTSRKDLLPVLTEEIGDSWIHGVGSDPILTAQLKALFRVRNGWLERGELSRESAEYKSFSDALLLVPEHTWGMDLKTWLPDYVNYEKSDFVQARANDVIHTGINPQEFEEYAWAYKGAEDSRTYSKFESSWAEQRGHLDRAIAALSPERQSEARAALAQLTRGDHLSSAAPDFDSTERQQAGLFSVQFGGDGSIVSLVDADGIEWAGPENQLAAYSYQTFDERDEQRWMDQYCRDLETTGMWAIPDQSKVGLNIAETLPASTFTPTVVRAQREDRNGHTVMTFTLSMDERASENWGAPRKLQLTYTFPHSEQEPIHVEFSQTGKDASRLPEAGWLTFAPLVSNGTWALKKIDSMVDPTKVVNKGNRRQHAVAQAVLSGERSIAFTPIDSPLINLGTPHLFTFDGTYAEAHEGFSVNLHNNMWGTNFTMWFSDDLTSRFEIQIGAALSSKVAEV